MHAGASAHPRLPPISGSLTTPRYVATRAWSNPFRLRGRQVKPLVQPDVGGEQDASLRTLEHWASTNGLPNQQVTLRDIPQQGRGFVAKQQIRKGEQLLQISESLLLTANKAAQECVLGQQLRDSDLPDWTVLATYLVQLLDEQQQGQQGYWAPYVAILPEQTGCILEWTPKEVDALLAGSPLHAKALKIRSAAAQSWQEVQPVLQQAAQEGLIKPESYTQQRYSWAFSILLTRLCRLPSRNNEEALIAWADMANHDANVTSFLDWNNSKKCVVFEPGKSYSPGEQVYVSYGQKTSGELLLSYGFLIPAETNPNDAYQLQIALDSNDSQHDRKLALLQQYGLSGKEEFPLRVTALPDGLLQYAAFVAATPGRSDEIPVLGEYLFKHRQFPLLDKVDCKLIGINYVLTICRAALMSYKRSLEADREYLESLQTRLKEFSDIVSTDTGVQVTQIQREVAAAVLRVRERQILSRTVFILQQAKRAMK